MRHRTAGLLSAVLRLTTVLSLTFAGPLSVVQAASPAAPASGPVVTATKTDRVVVGGSEANPGDTLRYSVTISNTGDSPATGVTFTDPLPAGLSLVPGSLNTSPLAFDQNLSTTEDTPLPITLTGADADGNPLTFSLVTPPSQGTLSGTAPNLTYTPNANVNGSDAFTFQVNDGKVAANQVGTVSITVTAVDDAPVAVADSATVTEDAAATAVDVLSNDTDVDAGPRSISAVIQPANGTVVITGGGTGLTYQPAANFCTAGTPDTFTYTLTPGGSTATVSMTVTCVDDVPVAVNDSATVTEDSGATAIPVLANDTDVDGGPKSISTVTQPANGTVAITGGGTGLTYTPNTNFCNAPPGTTPDTFTYTLTPGGSTATVGVTVTCVDDAPLAVADSATVTEDAAATAIDVLANDTDVDGGPKSVASVTQPAHGTVAITGGGTGLTYTPNANFCTSGSPDTFTYTLNGGSTATVSVTVTCVNDGPAIDLDANDDKGTPGSNFAVTFTEGNAATLIEDPVDATLTDVDNTTLASLTVTLTNLLDTGFETLSADVTGTSITANYVPATGVLTLTGPDTVANFQTVLRKVKYRNTDNDPNTTPRVILFVANDGATNGNTATSTVTIVAVDTPPTAVSDDATVVEDSGANAINVLANDTDPDGGPKSIASVMQPGHGSVVITGGGTGLTYTPNANYCNVGPGGTVDYFTYTLTPGGSTTAVTVLVTCVDDAPGAVNDSATVTEDAAATAIDVLTNDTDVDGGPKSISAVTQPANGTVVITGGGTGLTYAPSANYCNSVSGTPDTFTYTLTPGSSTATVSVTVTCVDDNPVAVADSATVTEDSGANAINVLANDTDVDGGPKSISAVTQPANGTVVITGGGTGLTYAPNANFCTTGSPDTFTYTLTPGGSSTTVSVTVTCVDDNPVAVADSATVGQNTAATTVNVLANDTDVDGGPKSIASVTQPANGTVVITNGGADLTYQPSAGYCNTPPSTTLDTFTYTLNGGSTATVSMTVLCDVPPTAVNDSATVNEDSSANAINVLANDTDPDGGPKSVASVTQPTNGVVAITGGGTGLTYTPNPNFCTSGSPDTFTYTLTPGGSTATVSVTVTCVDDNPVAVADSATVNEDAGATAIAVLTNDTDVDGGPKSISAVTQPAHGVVVITGGGTGLTYQPNANYCNNPPGATLETFTYTLTPGGSSATVTVTVTCVNDPPVADNDTFDFIGNTDLVVDLPALTTPHTLATTPSGFGVLDGDSDPVEGDPIAVSAITVGACTDMSAPFDCSDPAVGRVQMQTNGRFIFTPAPGDTGATETFQYTLTDSPAVGAPASATGTVTLTRSERVWYIKNNAPAGGNGTSSAPFNTIAAFNAAPTYNGDIVYIFEGTTGTTPLSGGITLKDGQKLWGQGIPLTLAGFGTLVNAANKPRLRSTASSTPAVSVPATAGNRQNVEIRGLDLETTGASSNAVDVTSSGANSVGITISDNTVRGATGNGVKLTEGGTGAFTATVVNNTLTSSATALDARTTAGAGTLTLSISNNSLTSSAGGGMFVDGSAGGTTWITAFANNTVSGDTFGNGLTVNTAKFDATPGGGYQTVSAGTTAIGSSVNPVGGMGMNFLTVSGDLAFTDLDIYTANGTALNLFGTGVVNTGAGTGTQFAVGAGVGVFEATGGGAALISDATIDLQLASLKSTSSVAGGVSLTNVSGTFSTSSGQITDAAGADFNISGGNAAVTYNGTIADPTGRLVAITNTTGGTKAFTGSISDSSGGSGQGILLDSNTGATVNFSGPLTLSTGANNAFTATGGGTVTATDTTSTIATTTGVALNVANTTIGSGGLKFQSISAGTSGSGPSNGIVLNNTGSSGGLTVSGTGSAGTGGTIQKTSGAGISLTSTRDVNLGYMVVQNSASDGISGSSVTNFSLANSSVTGNGDATTERGVEFTNLWGTASVTNSTVSGNAEDNLYVTNSSGTLTLLTVTNSTFSNTSTTIGNDGILFLGTGTAVMAISVSGSTFSNNRGDHFQAATDADTAHTATVDVVFQNNTLTCCGANPSGGGITLNPSGAHRLTFDVLNNNIQGARVSAISVNLGVASTAAARLEGTISGNTIGTPATAGSGSSTADGIDIFTNGAGTTTVAVTGNNIYQWTNPYGISLIARDNSSGTGRLNATITGNTLSNPNTAGFPAEAIFLNAGPAAGDNHQVCLDLGGAGALANSFAGAGNTAGGFNDFRLRQRASTTVRLPGYSGGSGPGDTASVVSYIQGRNNGTETGSASVTYPTSGGGFVGGAACAQPALAAKRVADAVSATQASAPTTGAAPQASAATPGSDAKPSETTPATAPAKTAVETPAKDTAPAKTADTVNVSIGTLPPGKSVTVVFDTQISGTPSLVSNQGSVAGGNFATVLTDDPDTPAPGDPTLTRVYLAVKPGVWRAGTWYLRNSLSDGPADTTFMYGLPTDVPLMCDWNGDGVKTAGVFRNGAWYLKNSNTTGISDLTLGYGLPGDTPICGDWNNDGVETPGVVRIQGGQLVWYLRNSNTSGIADTVFAYGAPGDRPVVGDWDGDGIDTPGAVRDGTWFLRNSNTNGQADTYFMYGIPPADRPIAGDWNGDGTDTAGALRGNLWLLRNANTSGSSDITFQYGAPGDTALVWR